MNERKQGDYILAIDAGTSSLRVMLLDRHARHVSDATAEIEQQYPQPGWVQQNPDDIRQTVTALMQRACGSITPSEIAAIGITNQRETTILWDRTTGQAVHPAIGWQCRRTQPLCDELAEAGIARKVHNKTGLRIDPYFSATKIRWIFDNTPGLRERAESGELAFGTVDTWLLWNLTGGRVHATEPTNASRTLLFNIETRQWDDDLLQLFDIPRSILPEIRPTAGLFGNCVSPVLGDEIPIYAMAGDQQAALFGQGCVNPGDIKNTYGTGCFLLINTGSKRHDSEAGLLTTIACGPSGEPVYALEGAIFSAGATIQWLRDGLQCIRTAKETEDIALGVRDSGGVYLVPAFTGLGAPHWNVDVRAAILGMTRGTTKAHIVRAALESIAYQVHDLVEAATTELGIELTDLKADGGASANGFLMQFQSDILNIPVSIPENIETTALGAGLLAGLACGLWESGEQIDRLRRTRKTYKPLMQSTLRNSLISGWRNALATIIEKHSNEGEE